LRKIVKEFNSTKNEVDELVELWKVANFKEKIVLKEEIENIDKKVRELEIKSLFSEKYDFNDAFLSIKAGAGGNDAQDWGEMLMKMYLSWAKNNKFSVKIITKTEGEMSGIRNVILKIKGNFAYGYLKGEHGVHRLVRLSPFNSAHRRETSFALVEVLPIFLVDKKIEIKEKDLRVDVFRSSGAGGQSVNTTDSAVRVIHLPTGIKVTCQNERSQKQNKTIALRILQAKLYKLEEEKRKRKIKNIKGETIDAEWGNQIRSYILHPYKLVKDHRINFESRQVNEVLAGKINPFIQKYLENKKYKN